MTVDYRRIHLYKVAQWHNYVLMYIFRNTGLAQPFRLGGWVDLSMKSKYNMVHKLNL